MSLEHQEIPANEQLATAETTTSPEQLAALKYNQAVEAAQKVIALAAQESGDSPRKNLTNVPASTARRMLDTMTWDRNFLDQTTQTYTYGAVPDEILEAQRLLYTSYQPSPEIQEIERSGYEKVCEATPDEEVQRVVTTWGNMSREEKVSYFVQFGERICKTFGFAKPLNFFFQQQATSEAEAFHVGGQQQVVIPPHFFDKHSLLEGLEILAHEIHHGFQEELLTKKESIAPSDVEWFKLSHERDTFIPRSDFNKDHNRYMSNPEEQDAYNAQKIFRSALEQKASSALTQKLESAGLPAFPELRKALKVYDALDEFNMVGIPFTEENLKKRLDEEEMAYLTSLRGDHASVLAKLSDIKQKSRQVLAGIV